MREYTRDAMTCPNTDCQKHGMHMGEGFCNKCGSKITICAVKTQQLMNMNDFMYEHFNNGDLFSVLHQENLGDSSEDKFVLLIPNHKSQGGVSIQEHAYGEYPLDSLSKTQEFLKDWAILIEKLTEQGFKFKTVTGCVSYYT